MSTEPEEPTPPPTDSTLDLGDGRTVISCESGFYRVLMPNGEVQAFPAKGTSAFEAAVDDIITDPPPSPPPPDAQIYAEQLAVGYVDAATGLHLKTTEGAQAKFGRMLILLDLGVTEDGMTAATEVTVWDYADQEQTITVGAFRALMLRYGLHCKAIFDAYAP